VGSSPVLQENDIELVKNGFLKRKDLYTIRAGELVRDPIHKQLTITTRELIKVREQGESKGCIHYDNEERACLIYENRPAQCAAFSCWDTARFMEVYERPKAERKNIIGDKILLRLIEEHERRCSYEELESRVKRIQRESERAIQEILELLKYDYHFRPFVSKKMNIDPQEMAFLFGRPFIDTISMFGLKVEREGDGSFFLTILDSQSATPHAP
jgi:Fe-S-cluster containining protein